MPSVSTSTFQLSPSELELGRGAWADWLEMLSHKESSLVVGFSWPKEEIVGSRTESKSRWWCTPFSWFLVGGDIFSDRLRTPEINALFFIIVLIDDLWSGELAKILHGKACDLIPHYDLECPPLVPGIDGAVSLLTGVVRLLVQWAGISIFLLGN